VLTATDAASTDSPLMERLRMVIPSYGYWAGHRHRVAWAVKLWPAVTYCEGSRAYREPALPVSDLYLTMSDRSATFCHTILWLGLGPRLSRYT
jgi:hypothetical protein